MRATLQVTTAIALCCAVTLGAGCERRQELEKLSVSMLKAGEGTASKTPMRNVVPSKPVTEPLQLTIEDERFLGDVARQLGVSVDAVLEWNQLSDSLLRPGQVLQVRTTKAAIDKFVDRLERRKAAKLAAEETKRQEKVRKEAEARAAKRAKQMAARAKKHGGSAALAAAAGGGEPTGVPLRPGEARAVGTAKLRGVSLPANLAVGQ
ncbi:MAG: LysM peptidoglycan-binding domain-containing protein [Deltaproteobacteria bacterium]|nr:LysM peptidoglycan-binding domain-containing protein [Deltaproteobacteria bacterium]